MLQIQKPLYDMSGEKAANVLGYPGFAVSYVIIPVSFLAMIC